MCQIRKLELWCSAWSCVYSPPDLPMRWHTLGGIGLYDRGIAMQSRSPSRTAVGAAVHRAVHQDLEGGKIFADPLAGTILGEEARVIIAEAAVDPTQRPMRLFIAARSRFAEDSLSAAVSRGVRQAVVLGAGLDTFSLRNPHAPLGLHVFEVDHPATQAWKRERLVREGLALPASLTFAPVDFEQQSLADGLRAAGFQPDRPAFFHWLGVVPYLTRDAIWATLSYIASPPESEVVFDYSEPIENYPSERRTNVTAVSARVSAIGEPWLSHFDPAKMTRELRARGFGELEDLSLADISVRFFGTTKGEAKGGPGPHIVRARHVA
jgi:methyltransferase (TIGR00027 family)